MIQALSHQGINLDFIKTIQAYYVNLKAQISTDIEGTPFKINRGIRQGGDPVSQLLFNCALEEIFRNLN